MAEPSGSSPSRPIAKIGATRARTWTCSSSWRSTSGPPWSAPVPSRRRGSATRSWPSSTRSARRWPSSSTSRRSSSSSGERVTRHLRGIVAVRRALRRSDRDHRLSRTSCAEGERIHTDPIRLGEGLTSRVIQSRSPLRMGTTGGHAGRAGAFRCGDLDTESWLGVPIMAGDRVIGVIALETSEAESVHGERRAPALDRSPRAWASPSRTRGCSTRRSACWPRPTSAPPSWRSSTASRRASPQNLDMQAMYDLVGDKIQEIFDAQVVDIGILRQRSRTASASRTPSSAACASRTNRCRSIGFTTGSARDARAAAHQRGRGSTRSQQYGQHGAYPGEPPKSVLFVPLIVGGEVRGVISSAEPGPRERLQRGRRPAADDAGRQPQRRARERAALRRDEAPAGRDRRARRRAGDHQQRPGGPRREARHAGDVRPGRRQDPGDLRRAGRRHRHVRRRGRDGALPVHDRARRAIPGRAHAARGGAVIAGPA